MKLTMSVADKAFLKTKGKCGEIEKLAKSVSKASWELFTGICENDGKFVMSFWEQILWFLSRPRQQDLLQ